MTRPTVVRPSRKPLGLALQLALATALLPAAAQAQDEPRALDRIEVTGSRIKKAEIEGQTPVLTLTREEIARTGLTSVADIVQQLTGAGSSLNTKFNSSGNFGFPSDGSGVGAGSATVDLRHLGSKRVLVLVDGIRWVNEASASGVSASTDLNTIPVSIIERIEILEDGASAIYGSDAVAGVVNIITRRNFDGASATAYYGEFDEGGETKSGDVSFGGSGDNFTFFLGASYTEQDGISSTKYGPAAVPVPGTGLTFGSSATPNGRFVFTDPDTGETVSITTPNGSFFPNGPNYPDDFIGFGTANRFNFSEYNLLLTPNERKGVFGQARFDFTENTSWYVRTLFNQRESLNQAAPEPIFLGPDAGTGNPYADDIFISADNPYNPFGFDLISSGEGANLILLARRPVEGGARRFYQDVDTWYFGTGLEGSFDLGERAFFWDLNYARSSNEAEQTNYGSYNIRRINLALGPLAACQADPQCVPLDLFSGVGSITQEMLDYVQPVVRDYSENNLQLFSGNISGDLFDMPAGPLAFAAGVEHRKLDGLYRPDALTVAGEYNGVPSLPTQGEYDVDEFYTELNIPVYATGDSQLDISVAGRYSDYSTFGGETTGKAGFRWQFSDQFLLRGTYAEGFRAPSIGELFGSAARFDATLRDPCLIGLDGSAPTAPADICAALGVPVGAEQSNPQISVTTGGNPNLEPEEADSTTLGFVFSPAFASDTSWSERLDFEFTYYRHEIDGAVQAIDAQTQLDLCTSAGPGSPFCEGITRASTGGINSFNNRLQNFGSIETDGYDFDIVWTLPSSDMGSFRINWQNTFVEEYDAVDALGTRQPNGVGVEVNNSSIPEWSSNLGLDWAYGDFSARWTLRHTSDLTEDCGDAASFPVCSDSFVAGQDPDTGDDIIAGTNHLGSTTYHDLQLGWKAPWFQGTQFTLGVNNVFSKDPPICLSCSLNGYDASAYDLPAGRFAYVRAEMKF
ncbi:TonB-dependent receptor plug domain-containing protein [Chiayiivirga flava]|uniref:Iron complex outermembrane receptor protein n=1 Tax=Chiayiivirga flava TaxID=659595 RepID=A0A7W8G1I6_9GAMM|nr:TonB-dependent receptor [Chiayiivirga flava]MBB5208898.1 iron complex outermembrane receptor protein [Chiayiivirga flava]